MLHLSSRSSSDDKHDSYDAKAHVVANSKKKKDEEEEEEQKHSTIEF